MNPVNDLLSIYKKYNLRLLIWERRGNDPKEWKGPHGVEAKGWNDPNHVYPIDQFDPERHNIGTFTGHELEPGKFLTDLDLDWAPGIILAKKLLPPTGFGFRRKGKSLSHAFYTTPERLDVLTFCDITDDGTEGNGQTFLEVRGGNSTHETMIAPSKHSEDVFIELVDWSFIAHVETVHLKACALDYAIACLLLKRLPGGLHHDGRIPFSGFLMKHGFSAERTLNLMEAICEAQVKMGVSDMSAGDVGDCRLVVGTTEQRLKDKEKRVAGGPKFAEWMGGRGKEIVTRIRKWLGAGSKIDGLILNPHEPLVAARIFVETRYMFDNAQSLYNQNAVFYRYAPPAYRETEEPTIRAEIWKFLDTAITWSGGKDPTLGPYQPTSTKVSNVVDALRGATNLPMIQAAPCWLEDNHPDISALDIVACQNGLLHVPTRKLLVPTAHFFTVNGLPFDYQPNFPPPEHWYKFLIDLWGDDPESIDTLQEIFGYLLTPDTRFQKIFMLIGPKRSGKGLIGRILAKLIGEANTCAPTLSSFGRDFGKQPLVGRTLALIGDARISGRSDTSAVAETLLSISGEDPQTVDRKYLPSWSGKLNTRFLILTNELPKIGDMSGALASRFIILLLRNSFFGKEDLGLFDRIEPELPGILNWALAGRDRLYARHYFVQPASSREMLQELEDLNSPTQAFLRVAVIGPTDGFVTTEDLFKLWRAHCADSGERNPGTAQNFGKAVRASIPYVQLRQKGPRGEQKKVWINIRLTPEWAERLSSESGAPSDGQPAFPEEDM
jgi:putative DNA primase/helicase